MRYWIKQASDLNRIAKSAEPRAIKSAFAEIDGLNLFLKSKKVQPTAALEISPPKNIWVLLRKTQEKTGENRPKSPICPKMVPRAGIEPATLGLEVLCSIQLSYRGISTVYQENTPRTGECFLWGERWVLATFRDPASQSNEHSSFVTSPCGLPQAILTHDPRVGSSYPNPSIENTQGKPGYFLWGERWVLNPRPPVPQTSALTN